MPRRFPARQRPIAVIHIGVQPSQRVTIICRHFNLCRRLSWIPPRFCSSLLSSSYSAADTTVGAAGSEPGRGLLDYGCLARCALSESEGRTQCKPAPAKSFAAPKRVVASGLNARPRAANGLLALSQHLLSSRCSPESRLLTASNSLSRRSGRAFARLRPNYSKTKRS